MSDGKGDTTMSIDLGAFLGIPRRAVSFSVALLVVGSVLLLAAEPAPASVVAFTVNRTGDQGDADPPTQVPISP
jgi:hypothetical protein